MTAKKNNPFYFQGKIVGDEDGWITVTDWARSRGFARSQLYYLAKKNFFGELQIENSAGCIRVKFPECEYYYELFKRYKSQGRARDVPRATFELFKEEIKPVDKIQYDTPTIADASNMLGCRREDNKELQKIEIQDAIDPKQIEQIEDNERKVTAKETKEHYDALNAKLKYEKNSGILIEKEFVRKELFNASRRVRDKILSLPARVSGELSAIFDPREIESFLQTELVNLLAELSMSIDDFENELDNER